MHSTRIEIKAGPGAVTVAMIHIVELLWEVGLGGLEKLTISVHRNAKGTVQKKHMNSLEEMMAHQQALTYEHVHEIYGTM